MNNLPLQKYLEDFSRWESQIQGDGWFFSRICDQLVASLSPADCFSVADEIAKLVLVERNNSIRLELASAIYALARASNTTEMPPQLSANWQSFTESLCVPEDPHRTQLKAIQAWYRVSP